MRVSIYASQQGWMHLFIALLLVTKDKLFLCVEESLSRL